jgi:hypothetical protein
MRSRERRLARIVGLVGVGFIVAALAITVSQIEVTDGELGVTRPCGSVFDGIADRSGWETWWARDLDEPDDATRAALVRTTRCPGAVNDGIVLAALLGAVGAAALVAGVWRGRRPIERRPAGDVERRLTRLGQVVSGVGAGLTVLGLVAVLLLLADADSTLFLYTDRAIVGAVGLVVLVPAIALFAMGRALTIAARDRDGFSTADTQEVGDG